MKLGLLLLLLPAAAGLAAEPASPARWRVETGPAAGWVAVEAATLEAAGWDGLTPLALSAGGLAAPLARVAGADGELARLVFYAAAYRTLYADRNVYWLAPAAAWADPEPLAVAAPPAWAPPETLSLSALPGDDGAEARGGQVSFRGKQLSFSADRTTGLRFAGLAVPPGAKILSARLEFNALANPTRPQTLIYAAEAADNAAPFAAQRYNLSRRARTAATATEALPVWTKGGVGASAELAALVQAVVDRPGWASGNAAAFYIRGLPCARPRTASAAESGAAVAPRLVVSWSVPLPPPAPPAAPDSYTATVRAERQAYYAGGLIGGRPGEERWYYAKESLTAGRTLAETLAADAVVAEAPAQLTVAVRPFASLSGTHRVEVRLNGVLLGGASWRGLTRQELALAVPAGLVLDGANLVELTLPLDSAGGGDQLLVDFFELAYPRRLVAAGGSFSGEVAVEAGARITIGGLGDPTAALVADVTAPASLIRLALDADAAAGTASFTVPATGLRRFALIEPAAATLLAPEPCGALPAPVAACDYLVISHPDFVAALEPLVAAHRAAGLAVEVARTDELYDRYGHGRYGPEALQAAVRAAAPRYLLLVGDTTFDYFGYTVERGRNFLPAWLTEDPLYQIPSDYAYGCLADGDELIDLAVGRFPVSTVAEAEALVAKTLARMAESSGYARELVLATSSGTSGEVTAFRSTSTEAVGLLGLTAAETERIDLALEGSAAKAHLAAALGGGARWVSFIGHGNHLAWANGQLIDLAGANALTNVEYPVVIQLSCLSNLFNLTATPTIGERLVTADGAACAAIGAAGVLELNDAQQLGRKLWTALAAGAAVGTALQGVQREYAALGAQYLSPLQTMTARSLNLLGDPAAQ